MIDHFQPQAVLLGRFGGVRAGVALVDIGQLDDGAVGHLLHLLAITLIGRRHRQREQMAQCIDRDVNLETLRRLAPS